MRPASVSGSALTLLTIGTRASCHSSASNAVARSSTTSAISGEWNAPETGRRTTRFAPAARIGSLGGLESLQPPRDDHLAGCVVIGHHELGRPPDAGDHRLHRLAVETEDGRHPAVRIHRGHELGASRNEAQRGGKVKDAGRDEGRVFADRVARHQRRLEIGALAQRPIGGHRGGEQAGLCLARVVEALRRPFPAGAADGPAEREIGLLEGRPRRVGALGQLAAHAHGLRALRTEQQGERQGVIPYASSSSTTWPYSTASPLSATR